MWLLPTRTGLIWKESRIRGSFFCIMNVEGMTMLQVECTRFKVKEGKSAVVDEWLQFLNDNIKDVLVTLEDEKCMSK